MENGTVESEKPDEKVSESNNTGMEESEKPDDKVLESSNNANKNDLTKLHERVSVVSMDGIGIDLESENTANVEEPIPEDVEPESDTDSGKNEPVSVDNIDLDLQGVDDEISNIESILHEMQLEQKKSHIANEQDIEMIEDEDPLGLLSFLDNRTEPQISASLSAHTSPTHMGGASEVDSRLSRSLPLVDDSPLKLNPERVESEV